MAFYQGMTLLNTLVFLASMGTRVFALVDALIRPAPAFEAAGKLTRTGWLIILGIGLAVGLFLGTPVSLLNIAALIAAIVYLVDVRPAVRQLGRPDRRNGPSGQW
jgi:hypothetical protein